MIREVALACVLVAAPVFAGVSDAPEPAAPAQPEAPADAPPETTASGDVIDETTLQSHRTPFEVLSERMIGQTSRAVRYDWRRSTVQVAVSGSMLLELNNFNSARIGGVLRAPVSGLLVEVGLHYVGVWGSDASTKLSLTPYRQAGRPRRFELDLLAGYALGEGVTTPRWSFIPATELVFMVHLGVRARWYEQELDDTKWDAALGNFFSPRLSDHQVQNMESYRVPGMEIDRTRYDLLMGFSFSVYFQNGAFISPRIMSTTPFVLLNPSGLSWWWDLTLQLGWSF
ncbi:MAG: hypothetical protein JNK82_17350 [Myxococcaceae bacterium]|nr:hypothetical protein [Myxococcaceae bacterium]